MDPCRQGSGQADTAELPQVPGERGPVVVERDCQQSRELVAAPRAAEADRHVVAREPAAAARENGRSAGQTRSVLLAVAARRTSDTVAVRGGPAAAGGATRGPRGSSAIVAANEGGKEAEGNVSEKVVAGATMPGGGGAQEPGPRRRSEGNRGDPALLWETMSA